MTEIERRILANQELILDALSRLLLVSHLVTKEELPLALKLADASGRTRAELEMRQNDRGHGGN